MEATNRKEYRFGNIYGQKKQNKIVVETKSFKSVVVMWGNMKKWKRFENTFAMALTANARIQTKLIKHDFQNRGETHTKTKWRMGVKGAWRWTCTWGASAGLRDAELLVRRSTVAAGLRGEDGRLGESLSQKGTVLKEDPGEQPFAPSLATFRNHH